MIELVYSPNWFYGKDIEIDIVSIFVLFLIAIFSIKYFRMDKKNKNYLYLAFSFLLIGLSFLFKITTNFTIYYNVLQTTRVGFITYTYNAVKSSDIIFIIGFLLYRIFTLLGLYILYLIYSKKDKGNIIIIVFLLLVSTYFSRSAYYIFHVTSLLFLIFITLQYYRNYHKTKQSANKWLLLSFLLITVSHAFFCFIRMHSLLYVIAEFIQLAGYAALLITFIKVLKDGKKKGKK